MDPSFLQHHPPPVNTPAPLYHESMKGKGKEGFLAFKGMKHSLSESVALQTKLRGKAILDACVKRMIYGQQGDENALSTTDGTTDGDESSSETKTPDELAIEASLKPLKELLLERDMRILDLEQKLGKYEKWAGDARQTVQAKQKEAWALGYEAATRKMKEEAERAKVQQVGDFFTVDE